MNHILQDLLPYNFRQNYKLIHQINTMSDFDLSELAEALEQHKFSMDSLSSCLDEIEEDMLHTQPAVKAYKKWSKKWQSLRFKYPKKISKWKNFIRSNFSTIKIYIDGETINKYIKNRKFHREIGVVLKKIHAGEYRINPLYPGIYIVKISADPEQVYTSLVKMGYIRETPYGRAHKGWVKEDSAVEEVFEPDLETLIKKRKRR